MARNKKDILYVDGYNIIYSWPDFSCDLERDFDQARSKLIDYMAEYKVLSGFDLVLVFDAQNSSATKETVEEIKGIEVVYTKAYETADSYIEKMLDKRGRLDHVRVATSDGALQRLILGRGGTRVTSKELRNEYRSLKARTIRQERKKKGGERGMVSLDQETQEKLEDLGEKMRKEDQ